MKGHTLVIKPIVSSYIAKKANSTNQRFALPAGGRDEITPL